MSVNNILKIKVSEISSLLGKNPYHDKNKTIKEIIFRNKNLYFTKNINKLKFNYKELKNEEIKKIESNTLNNIDEMLKNTVNEEEKKYLEIMKKTIKYECENRLNFEIIKKELKTKTENDLKENNNINKLDLSKHLGIIKENEIYEDIIKHYNKQNPIDIKDKFIYKKFDKYIITGKVDGFLKLNDKPHIIEIKKRSSERLYYKTPEYDIIQTKVYGFLKKCDAIICSQYKNDRKYKKYNYKNCKRYFEKKVKPILDSIIDEIKK